MGNKKFSSKLIAPCGINCNICRIHLRNKNKCPGCRIVNPNKPITRTKCKIKTCIFFKNGKGKFCFQCNNFPCSRLKHLDERYNKKYYMTPIENLKEIRNKGLRNFIKDQEKKWICKERIICGHDKEIYIQKV